MNDTIMLEEEIMKKITAAILSVLTAGALMFSLAGCTFFVPGTSDEEPGKDDPVIEEPGKDPEEPGTEDPDISDDIGGSGDLPKRADNVFALEPNRIELRGELVNVTTLRCLKNRMFGGTKEINLQFDVKSKRFYRPGETPDKKYGWELPGQQVEMQEISEAGDEPF